MNCNDTKSSLSVWFVRATKTTIRTRVCRVALVQRVALNNKLRWIHTKEQEVYILKINQITENPQQIAMPAEWLTRKMFYCNQNAFKQQRRPLQSFISLIPSHMQTTFTAHAVKAGVFFSHTCFQWAAGVGVSH